MLNTKELKTFNVIVLVEILSLAGIIASFIFIRELVFTWVGQIAALVTAVDVVAFLVLIIRNQIKI